MSNYETRVETGIDSICVMVEMSDYVEHEALLNGLSSMFNKFRSMICI